MREVSKVSAWIGKVLLEGLGLGALLLTGLILLAGLALDRLGRSGFLLRDLLRRLFSGLLGDDAGGGRGFFLHGDFLRAIGDANTGGGRADA